MTPIKTVSKTERFVREGILTVMVAGFALAFLRDGFHAYPQKNLAVVRAEFPEIPADARAELTYAPRVRKKAFSTFDTGTPREEIEAVAGPPAWVGRLPAGRRQALWVGPGGVFVAKFGAADRIIDHEWRDGKKDDHSLWLQKLIGGTLAPLGAYLLLRWLLMLVWGATLSDDGLKPTGRSLVPYGAITNWDTTEFRRKGRIRLSYDQGGKTRTYVLDEYKLKAFPQIVAEICARRGFDNPIKRPSAATASTDPGA